MIYGTLESHSLNITCDVLCVLHIRLSAICAAYFFLFIAGMEFQMSTVQYSDQL